MRNLYIFNFIVFVFSIITCTCFGGLMCLGIYTFIQDLKLIDNNLATDVTVIIIGYMFFKLSWSVMKGLFKHIQISGINNTNM